MTILSPSSSMKFILSSLPLVFAIAISSAKAEINAYVSFETYCWVNGYGQDKGCTRELDRCAIFYNDTPRDPANKIKVDRCPNLPIQNSCTGREGYADVYYYKTSGEIHRGKEYEQCLATNGTWR